MLLVKFQKNFHKQDIYRIFTGLPKKIKLARLGNTNINSEENTALSRGKMKIYTQEIKQILFEFFNFYTLTF